MGGLTSQGVGAGPAPLPRWLYGSLAAIFSAIVWIGAFVLPTQDRRDPSAPMAAWAIRVITGADSAVQSAAVCYRSFPAWEGDSISSWAPSSLPFDMRRPEGTWYWTWAPDGFRGFYRWGLRGAGEGVPWVIAEVPQGPTLTGAPFGQCFEGVQPLPIPAPVFPDSTPPDTTRSAVRGRRGRNRGSKSLTRVDAFGLSDQAKVKAALKRQLRKGSYCWHGGGCRHTPVCDPVCRDVAERLPY